MKEDAFEVGEVYRHFDEDVKYKILDSKKVKVKTEFTDGTHRFDIKTQYKIEQVGQEDIGSWWVEELNAIDNLR